MAELNVFLKANILWVQLALTASFIFLGVVIWMRSRKRDQLLKYYANLMDSVSGGNLESVLQQISWHQEATDRRVGELNRRIEADEELALSHISRVGLVRYKAFRDIGGDMSFSLALLDGLGSGLVLTGIHGSQETRVYAKGVDKYLSAHPLSGEEQQAILKARGEGTTAL